MNAQEIICRQALKNARFELSYFKKNLPENNILDELTRYKEIREEYIKATYSIMAIRDMLRDISDEMDFNAEDTVEEIKRIDDELSEIYQKEQ